MYKKHFDLERRIFRGNAAGADVFVGPQTARILTGIKKALGGPDAVVTVTGPVGTGKSTAVSHALGAISGKNAVVRVGRLPLQRGEVLDLLFDHMRIQQRPPRGNQKLSLFRQLLFNLAQNDSRMFILVEDAPFLGSDLLAELEMITAADTGPSDGANIVLLGDDSLRELLSSKPLARLRQRVRLRRNLEPCTVEELAGYLAHCFRQAGGDFDKIFATGAVALLHELSGGILRVANNLVESSMEAASESQAGEVQLDLIAGVANEEFGLTGTFSAPPQIAGNTPEPRHTDDATAELVALSMPKPEPVPETADPLALQPEPKPEFEPQLQRAPIPEPEPEPAPEPEPEPESKLATAATSQASDDIPELIQDTQPALAVLPATAEEPAVPELIHDTLPDLDVLSPELAQQVQALEDIEPPQLVAEPSRETAKPQGLPKPQVQASQSKPPEQPTADPEPVTRVEPAPTIELELADADAPIISSDDEDKPEWDRDPTLAELRPDLEALERAMAVAHGRDPENEGVEEPPPPVEAEKKDPTLTDVPKITLDDSINRKVDAAAIEQKQREIEESGVIEDEADPAVDNKVNEKKQKQAEAELEKIAEGLAQAKTIEDVDDKMAETLFGEELSVAAAAVAKRVAAEAAEAANAGGPEAPVAPVPATNGGQNPMEEEFEEVWGEKPTAEVSIESQIEGQTGGMDISASQRLATVRALSTEGKPAPATDSAAPQPPAGKPVPIEEQITTSMTQTLEALNVRPNPASINDDSDDDDDNQKRGFFSRFKRS
jgi:type II secretory pathway predicted ATPase ExeA